MSKVCEHGYYYSQDCKICHYEANDGKCCCDSCKVIRHEIRIATLEQQVAALTEYNKTRTDELIAAGKQVAALTKEKDDWYRYHGHVTDELVISQAREAMLRTYIAQGLGNYSLRVAAADLLVEAIALPTDDSALMERLKQEYERGYADATREGVA